MQRVQSIPLTPAPTRLVLWHASNPWRSVWRMIGIVILCFLIANVALLIPASLLDANLNFKPGPIDGAMFFGANLCLLPLLAALIFARKPRLSHLMKASQNPYGSTLHMVGNSTVVSSIEPTTLAHHLIRDNAPLELPSAKKMWSLFAVGIIVSTVIFVYMSMSNYSMLSIILAMVIAIPAWLIGFSGPVFAWWSMCQRFFSIRLTRMEGEMMLIAGMLSAVPALMINSLFYPLFLDLLDIEVSLGSLGEGSIIFIAAPVGEEICKALAVLACAKLIDNPRKGFYVGFSVGMGFALLENMQYIMTAMAGEYMALSYLFTTTVRGIGSILGHGVWTGISGFGIGHYLVHKRMRDYGYSPQETDEGPAWVVYDSDTGQATDSSRLAPLTTMPVPNWWAKRIGKGWNLPDSAFVCVLLAIAGHAFWNGTSWGIGYIFYDSNEILLVILILTWTAFMIILLWFITLRIIPGVFATTYSQHRNP